MGSWKPEEWAMLMLVATACVICILVVVSVVF